MQSVATWLVARPQNAVLAMAATLLPVLQLLSGAILVLLVLQQGVRLAVIKAGAAFGLLAAIALLVGAPVAQIIDGVMLAWLPALLLAVVLRTTRSLTLTLQVSAILAALAPLLFQLVVSDAVTFWQPVLTTLIDWSRQNDLQMQVEFLQSDPVLAADMMTLAAVLTRWTLVVMVVLIGYRLFDHLSGFSSQFGRFRELNFGRVIALSMALASVFAVAAGADWLQHIAVVLLAIFWLQGLAIVHWMYMDGHLPLFVVIATYLLMLVLHVFLVLALAVLGYTDAWFRYRRRASKQT